MSMNVLPEDDDSDSWDRFLADATKPFVDAYTRYPPPAYAPVPHFASPPPKSVLAAADFSQIEARVLAWLAGDEEKLDVFRRHEDIYVYAAGKIGSKDRQYGKVCELGLGFGMGWMKFIDTALKLAGIVLTETKAKLMVSAWRLANSKTVALWASYQAAFAAMIDAPPGSTHDVGEVTFERGNDAIGIKLPSRKRRLIYRNPRWLVDAGGDRQMVYDGVDQYTKQWGPVKTYGGKLAENVTQAVARDVMAAAMLVLDGHGVDLRLTVHDEIVAVAVDTNAQTVLNTMLATMRKPPSWAPALPVWAEGWISKRYKK